MKTTLLSSLCIATAAVTGLVANASSAAAFTWNSSWQQPTIMNKSQAGFNDAPYQRYVQREGIELPGSEQKLVDPSKLFLKFAHNVSVSFINEGAGYRNQLAYTSTGATNGSGLLFNDISCSNARGSGCVMGSAGGTLKQGDTVNIGKVKGGSQLDFFLRADGFNRGNNAHIFGTQTAQNSDGLQHVVAYAVSKTHLLLGFEDLYGAKNAKGLDKKTGFKNENSDRDFNDTVFVVDVGEKNIRYLTGQKVPEPSVALSLIGLGAAGLMLRRRQKNSMTK